MTGARKTSVWVTADQHWGHERIIQYCNRPFNSVAEMDEAMIHRWNMVVKPNDIVYHLGDFNWGKSVADVVRYRSRLNGTIHLICGNHDKKNICAESLCFESIADIATIKIDGDDIVLCHYPLAEWAGYYRGAWHLHGHCHGTLKSKEPRRVDVGVDSWSFAPVSLEEIKRAA